MLSKTTALLLGLIRNRPVNAYEVTKLLSRLNIRRWYPIPDSTVYAALRTAVKKGYLSGSVEKEGKMPDKTIYALTGPGKKDLESTLQCFLSEVSYDITPFTIAVFFLSLPDDGKTLALLREREELLLKHQEGLKKQIQSMQEQKLPPHVICNVKQNLYLMEAQEKGTKELISTLLNQ